MAKYIVEIPDEIEISKESQLVPFDMCRPSWWEEAYNKGKADAQKEWTARWECVKSTDMVSIDFRCSACHRYRFHNGAMRKKYKYCPACGAKMIEPQESEVSG